MRRREFDEAWKKILDKYFIEFMKFYFPKIAEQIDFSKGYTFLDQELQKIMRGSKSKKRRVDKLVKVFLFNKQELWILIHVEVQTYVDKNFAERMFC